jgi:PTH1 family peptidyl-tRNA hydrolase|tara:strand:- start:10567 stop:11139 length:573 start_codon:yes stop_codon:yes gene_type:complete
LSISEETILLVGLGNPGEKYKNNRHNVGFMTLDHLTNKLKFGRSRTKFLGRTSMGSFKDIKLISFKPQTFMNESGRAVREASNFYKINPERIVVFHDDIDLAFGDVKLKKGGSNAGHNGLASIDENIGTNYVRLRVGISHPGEKEKVNNHVLGDFTKEEYENFEKILSKIHKNFDLIIDGNIKKFQSSMK